MNIIILGAGLIGLPMALDLQKDNQFNVTLCDIDKQKLDRVSSEYNIDTLQADLTEVHSIQKVVANADMVLNAVPGFMGFATLKTVIEAGKNVVDITFFPEDLFDLDELAKVRGVIAISDIGVAPGMSNILSSYADHQLDQTESIRIYVGGLPKVREWPWEYKAVFSPIDVIEEYSRHARFIKNGREIVMPALSDAELIDIDGVGTLEAFNSDGLRSLMKTIDCPDMVEKTMRYPGHIDKIKVLQDTGFFSEEEVEVSGKMIRPLDLTTSLLFPKWEFKKGDEDITVMKIIVAGQKDKRAVRYEWSLYDEYDPQSGVHSMARTTGYTATAAVRMIAAGLYDRKGVSPPEYIGKCAECVEFILKCLRERGVVYKELRVES